MSAPLRAGRPAALLDLAVVLVLAATALAGLTHVFGGLWFVPAAAVGIVTGTALGWVGARWRWSALGVAGSVILAYLLLGGPLVYPGTTLAGLVPTAETLRSLVLGAVRVWKGFVTAPAPVTAFPELVAVPLLAGLVATALATSLALRLRRPAWALLPLAVLGVGMILLSTARPTWPVAQGGLFAVTAVAWLGWRRAGHDPAERLAAAPGVEASGDLGRLRRRRLIGAAGMLGVVAVAVGLTGSAVAGAPSRYVVRDQVQPPLDLRQYASPLESFRRYVKDAEQDVMFTVDGLPDGARLRLAVLDTYTGTVMDVAGGDRGTVGSGTFEVAGAAFAEVQPTAGRSVEVDVEVGTYSGVWVPSPGLPSAVTFSGPRAEELAGRLYVNDVTGTMADTAVLREGDAYQVAAVIPDVLTLDELKAQAPTRAPEAATSYRLESAAQAVRTIVGTQTDPLTQVRLIRDALLATGVFSDGLDGQPPSPAGHGSGRLNRLLAGDRWIGNDEQFAVAAALMVRSLGYGTRVVMGFYPDESAAQGGQVELRGTDVHAWLEVAVDGVGWVPVDVTPDEDNVPQDQDPRSNREPQPVVIQEPPTPDEPEEAPQPPLAQEQSEEKAQDEGIDLGAYLRIAALVGVPLLVLVGPLVAVAVAKARRRRRRRTAAHPAGRVSGGWREVADTAVDLGAQLTAGATRRETAAGLHPEYGGERMLAVADRADQVVFGKGDPSDEDVAVFWGEVDSLIGELRSQAGPWRRARARFSVRSLRLREAMKERSGRVASRVRRGGRR